MPSQVASTLTAQQLDVLLRGLEGISAPAACVRGLLELAQRCEEAPEALGELVSAAGCDVALSARLIQLANARGAGACQDVTEAAGALGAEAVRSAACSLTVAPADGAGSLDRVGLWRHCIGVACAARELAASARLDLPPGVVFLAGLLHDLGKLALAEALPKSYRRVVESARRHDGHFADYERKIIGVDHCVAGRRLAELWRLPVWVQETIWLHHQPLEALPASLVSRRLVAVVGLADTLARQVGYGVSGNQAFPQTAAELATPLGIGQGVLDELADRLGELGARCEARLSLDRPLTGEGQTQVLLAANAELGKLNERLLRRSGQAEAFGRLRQFAASLTAESGISDILQGIASTLASAPGSQLSSVVAYSVSPERRQVLAVRVRPGESPRWRTLDREAVDWPGGVVAPEPAGLAMSRLALAGDGLADWIDVDGYLHLPLVCSGRWVGGALFAAPAAEGFGGWTQVVESLGGAMAMALAIVQGRSSAMLLSEQLASASQVLTETQQALAEARTLAMIGEMAAGAAHEMNTPLAVISGRAQLMREKAPDDKQRRTWQTVAEQAHKISDIITALMEFAAPPPPQPQVLEMAGLLEEAKNSFQAGNPLQAANCMVDIEVGNDTPAVYADRGQLVWVLVELLGNAATAGEASVRVHLKAEPDELNDAVLVMVADDGPGMDPATLAKAMTPFFSLQKAGRRRGMGLPRAKRFVENNGGRIWVRSQQGHGTSVLIQLPSARPGDEGAGEA